MGILRFVVLVSLGLVLFGLKTAVSQPQQQSQVPCFFIFGDSLVDNGNNNRFSFALSLYVSLWFFFSIYVLQKFIFVGCFRLRGLITDLMASTFPKVQPDGSPTVAPTSMHLVTSMCIYIVSLIFVSPFCCQRGFWPIFFINLCGEMKSNFCAQRFCRGGNATCANGSDLFFFWNHIYLLLLLLFNNKKN